MYSCEREGKYAVYIDVGREERSRVIRSRDVSGCIFQGITDYPGNPVTLAGMISHRNQLCARASNISRGAPDTKRILNDLPPLPSVRIYTLESILSLSLCSLVAPLSLWLLYCCWLVITR